MQQKSKRRYLVLPFMFLLFAVTASAQTQTFECLENVIVGIKNLPNGWQPGFGNKNIKFEETAIAGQTMVCLYGTTQAGSFILQQQFPSGLSCQVEKITNKPNLNRRFSCARVKPPIKIPGKNQKEKK